MRESLDMEAIQRARVPTVVSPHYHPSVPGFPNIFGDDDTCGMLAANHLLERGFRNFAFVGFKNVFWSHGRCKGFQRRIQEYGKTCYIIESPLKEGERLWRREHDQLVDFLVSASLPVGIFAVTDYVGRRILEVCKELRLKVPHEVAVVGVGNDCPICELADPELSSVAYNCEGAGFQAAQLLDSMMNGQNIDGMHVVNEARTVIPRQSSDTLAVTDPVIAKAIEFIRSKAVRPLTVEEIASAVYLSRRSLERRFRSVLNSSIHEEIRRTRIARAVTVLLETDRSISEIAYELSYSSPKQLHREFFQEKAMPPGEFRARFRGDKKQQKS